MRTSRELYHWIRWDPRFDPSDFAFGYDDHAGAPKEIALTAFVADGEIPWHRVLYLRRGRQLVWDRRTGVDRLVAEEGRSAVRWPSLTRFSKLEALVFDGHTWASSPADRASSTPATLSLLAFNVLDEQHVPPEAADPSRKGRVIDAIVEADADVVVLEEVTGAFFASLTTDPRIRASYAVVNALSESAAQSVVILSRHAPSYCGYLRFSSHKHAVVVGLELASGPALVAGVHLPSDYATDARDIRRAYLRTLVAALDEEPSIPVVLAGDFNEGDETSFENELAGFVDAWSVVGDGRGETWEPAGNVLAAHASRTGLARRLDRVFVRDLVGALPIVAATVLRGDRDRPPSDHWPIRVEFVGGTALDDDAPVESTRDRIVATLDRALNVMLGEGAGTIAHAIGSHAMGAADEESDLDVLAMVPAWCDAALFLDEAARALAAVPTVEAVEVIDTANVPIVRCVIDGVSVDLQRATRPARMDERGPGYLDEAALDAVDPDSRRALLSAVDARVLREFVAQNRAEARFATLVRRVKRWARARQLAGQAYGMVSGLAWSVLAALSAVESARDGLVGEGEDDALLARFFARYAGWSGDSAVSISAVGPWVRGGRDVYPVLAPASPARNVTRSMTPATRTHVRDELARAHALAGKGEIDRALEPITARPKFAAVIRGYGRDARSLRAARGFIEWRMVRAVMALDERGLRPRPLPGFTEETVDSVCAVIGLRTGASPSVRAEVERAFEDAPCVIELEW
jgi:endonuclease/exonuclease/phosphatase family metal-dependent hydrolase